MKLLKKGDILAADDLPHETVDVPEWGGAVRVRVLTGAERDQFYSKVRDADPVAERCYFLSLVICDETNQPILTAEELGKKSHKVLDRLETIALELNGLGAKSVDAAEKN